MARYLTNRDHRRLGKLIADHERNKPTAYNQPYRGHPPQTIVGRALADIPAEQFGTFNLQTGLPNLYADSATTREAWTLEPIYANQLAALTYTVNAISGGYWLALPAGAGNGQTPGAPCSNVAGGQMPLNVPIEINGITGGQPGNAALLNKAYTTNQLVSQALPCFVKSDIEYQRLATPIRDGFGDIVADAQTVVVALQATQHFSGQYQWIPQIQIRFGMMSDIGDPTTWQQWQNAYQGYFLRTPLQASPLTLSTEQTADQEGDPGATNYTEYGFSFASFTLWPGAPAPPPPAPDSVTMAAAAETFAATAEIMTVTGDAGTNTLKTITGRTLDHLTIVFQDALITVQHNASHAADTINLKAGVDLVSSQYKTLRLVHDGTAWLEI